MNTENMLLGADPRQACAALRARLGEISAASQVLLSRAREEDRSYLAAINRAAFRCARLLSEEELARRLSGGAPAAELAPMDLVSWCREGCGHAAELLKSAGLELGFACGEEVLPVLGDRELLTELLYALISNAAKAMGAGGRVEVALTCREGRAVLTVGDEGDGMGAQALDRLAGGAALPDLDPGAGGGLGLRLCRAIAQAHGGLLMVETGPDAGTRAAVSLPVPEAADGGALLCAPPAPDDGPDRALEALSDVLPAACFMV